MKNRYSLRKLSVGLCSVVLGCMLLQNATTQEVKADAETTRAPQTQSAGSTSDGTGSGTKPTTNPTSDPNAGKADPTKKDQGLDPSEYQEETVTSKNFKDYFNTHKFEDWQKVTPPDQNDDGSFTLTHVNKGDKEDESKWNGQAVGNDRFQIGQINLKDKIDTDTDFEMKGQIQLRNKDNVHEYDDNKNGDGIGIAFHPGNPDELGLAGGDLGIGGLPDAIGFKFDTFFNKDGDSNPQTSSIALTDDKGIGHKDDDILNPTLSGPYGSYLDDSTPDPDDPSKYYFDDHINSKGKFDKGFAGFVYTPDIKDPDKVYGDTYVDKNGNLQGQIRIIDKNDPNWDKGYTRYFAHPITNENAKTQLIDIEGWHDFSISYKGDTHVLTVTYGSSQSWSVDLDDVYGKDKLIKTDLPKSLSLCITGSTGWYTNEQKIKIDKFTYRSRPDGKLTYIDDDKNDKDKTITPTDETLNNLFVRNGESIDENNTSISNGINYWTKQNYELIDSNWLVNKGNGHYEIHLKHKVNKVSELKTFEEVINYVDQNGNELAPSTTQKITVSRELKHDLVTDKYTEESHKGTTTFDEVPVKMVITKNGVDYNLDYVDPGYATGNKSVKAISPNLDGTTLISITVHYTSETPDSGSNVTDNTGSDVNDGSSSDVTNDSGAKENTTSESTTNVETPTEDPSAVESFAPSKNKDRNVKVLSKKKERRMNLQKHGKNTPKARQDALVLKKNETGKPSSDLKFTNAKENNNSEAVVKANEESQRAQLPQTGDKKATGLTVFGMLVSLLGMAGLSVSDRFKKLSKAKKSK